MRKILVTGGTVFVSKFVAEYFRNAGNQVYVLNRNHHEQLNGVTVIEGDRNHLGDQLRGKEFDVILDITAYTSDDVVNFLSSGVIFKEYILLSSSAVYPENKIQPFTEETTLAPNKYWGAYGTNKIEAEKALLSKVPEAYILRPPYLYGKYNNVYREAFVFECALNDRKFYLPKDGEMKLQFFDVEDLCKLMEKILEEKPKQKIYNVGNEKAVTIKEWVALCYEAAGKNAEFINIHKDIEQRNYFSFYNYEYMLDVTKQKMLLPNTKSLKEGLKEAFIWYKDHADEVNRKSYIQYIDDNFKGEEKC